MLRCIGWSFCGKLEFSVICRRSKYFDFFFLVYFIYPAYQNGEDRHRRLWILLMYSAVEMKCVASWNSGTYRVTNANAIVIDWTQTSGRSVWTIANAFFIIWLFPSFCHKSSEVNFSSNLLIEPSDLKWEIPEKTCTNAVMESMDDIGNERFCSTLLNGIVYFAFI